MQDRYQSAESSGVRSMSVARVIAIGLFVAAAALLVWVFGDILLLLFAGILVAAVLDAAVKYLPLPIARPWKLAFVVLIVTAGIGAGAYWAGASVIAQFRDLQEVVVEQATRLRQAMENVDLPFDLSGDPEQIVDMIPDNEEVMGLAGSALWTVSGIATSGFTVVLMGVFLAISPGSYLKGMVILVPTHRRERTAEVLTETGRTLQAWLLGQLAAMAMVGVSVFAFLWALGVPNALALAGISALLNFIPFLGPILAAIPVGLVALMQGSTTFLLVMGGFLVIQWIEGYLINPLIQHKAVHLPPAHSLAFLMLMGALFGELGVALATPLLAVIRVMVLRFYVEDLLERETETLRQDPAPAHEK